MGWDGDYSFRVPCQAVTQPNEAPAGHTVLFFDLDNYIGRASEKKDEAIIQKKADEVAEALSEEAKSFFYPPDDEEPQNIKVIKVARQFTARDFAYCHKQGTMFMEAASMGLQMAEFAPLFMTSQLAGVFDVSFAAANDIQQPPCRKLCKRKPVPDDRCGVSARARLHPR